MTLQIEFVGLFVCLFSFLECYLIFVYHYPCKYENVQDGNKESESNIPLAHDLICAQHKHRLSCIFDNNE